MTPFLTGWEWDEVYISMSGKSDGIGGGGGGRRRGDGAFIEMKKVFSKMW